LGCLGTNEYVPFYSFFNFAFFFFFFFFFFVVFRWKGYLVLGS